MNDKKIKELEKEIEGLKETVAVYLGSLISEVVKEFGDEGREVVKEAARKGGLWQANKFIKDNNIEERGRGLTTDHPHAFLERRGRIVWLRLF